MEYSIESNVPDVYGQRKLIESIVETAFQPGEGRCTVRVVEPADSPAWIFKVMGDDGIVRGPMVVSVEDQLNYDSLRSSAARRLQRLVAE